jgi:hypothetical protein
LELLERGEFGGASVTETEARLAKGDEYLDLEQLHVGVQRAQSSALPFRHILPRKAVHEDTWRKILRQLNAAPR